MYSVQIIRKHIVNSELELGLDYTFNTVFHLF